MGIVQVELYPKYRIHFPIKRDVQLVWRLSDERYILWCRSSQEERHFLLRYIGTPHKILDRFVSNTIRAEATQFEADEAFCVSATV